MRYLWTLALLLGVVSSCVLEDVDYTGKRCAGACPAGLSCIEGVCAPKPAAECPGGCPDDHACVANACVPTGDQVGSRCTDTCGNGLTCLDRVCAQIDSRVYVSDFRFDWATPNAIRWAWTLHGNGPELESYELAITSATSTAPGVKVWTSRDAAELGGYQLRRSDGFDIVDGSITYDLDPQTSYTATLTVHDTFGNTFVTTQIRGSTDAPRQARMHVFNGSIPPGSYLLPVSGFNLAPDGGVEDGPSLQYVAALDSEEPRDFQNLRVGGMDLEFDSTLTPKLFETAYLEFWIRGHGVATSSWAGLRFRIHGGETSSCGEDDCLWGYPGKWLYHPDTNDAVYRRVQIPLSVFENRGVPLTAADLTGQLQEVSIGCPYLDETDRTELDRISIFW